MLTGTQDQAGTLSLLVSAVYVSADEEEDEPIPNRNKQFEIFIRNEVDILLLVG